MMPPLFPPTIDSKGEQTNPDTTTVLASVVLRIPGTYEVLVLASASANAQFQLQHRNDRNTSTIDSVAGFYCPANNPVEVRGLYQIGSNELVRVMMDDNLTGTAWATVYAWPIKV